MQHRFAGEGAVEQLAGDRADLGPWRLDRDVRAEQPPGDEPGQQRQPVGGGLDPARNAVLLRALLLDKAVYEVIYEARNRPTWLAIPLESIAEMQP